MCQNHRAPTAQRRSYVRTEAARAGITHTLEASQQSRDILRSGFQCCPHGMNSKPGKLFGPGAIEDDGSLTLISMASDNVTIHRVLPGMQRGSGRRQQ